MKKTTLLMAAFLIAAGMNAQTVLFEDDFESYSAAANNGGGDEVPPGYLNYDVNSNGYTWGLSKPSDWTQPMGNIYSGNFMISVSFHSGPNTAVQADAILVLPQISIPAGATGVNLSFFAGSGTDTTYFNETYDVIVSTASDLNSVLAGDVIHTETLPFQGGEMKGPFNLDAYAGQDIYISFHHRDTFDEWVLGIDDILVEADVLNNADHSINGFNYHFSPQTQNLTINAAEAFSNISIFNVLGQQVVNKNLSSTNEVINLSSVKSGVYIVNVIANGQTTTFKLAKR